MLENDVKELRVLAAEHRNTVFEIEDRIAKFPRQKQKLTAILADLHTDREALRKLPIDPERKLPVFKITFSETEYTDRKEAAKAFEAKKNAPKREKTCYFERAKMKRDAAAEMRAAYKVGFKDDATMMQEIQD